MTPNWNPTCNNIDISLEYNLHIKWVCSDFVNIAKQFDTTNDGPICFFFPFS